MNPIVIIGAGFAGIGMGIRLKLAGITDFVIVEKSAGIGGTWYDNHYPGAACDIESHLYSFSFEPNPRWSRSFAPQPEILEYLERCVDKYGLRSHIRCNVEIVRATYDDAAARWRLETQHKGTACEPLGARFVIAGTGGLSRPSLPDIAGLDQYQGPMFHTARWDHDVPLDGKTVSIIGTGASAIQVIPQIAPRVGKLKVFQRTAPWIMPKRDRALAPSEQSLFAKLPVAQKLARAGQYLLHEATAYGFVKNPKVLALGAKLARAYLDKSVRDLELRRKLTPSYAMGCKRILLANDYYPALCRPNVELITQSIRGIEPTGVRTTEGTLHKSDAIILATGFYAAEMCTPFEVHGRNGASLADRWAQGAEAYLGMAVSGFPNLFMIVGPNTGLGHSSMIFMIESQIAYILDCIQKMERDQLRSVEVKADAQARYNAELQSRFPQTVWATGCQSWYLAKGGRNTTLWPGWTWEFRSRTRRWNPTEYALEASS